VMRLQLTIRRHSLPPTNILWTVRAQDPTSISAHASATISQLLEDVNDIVQLESDDWGLEDYVVEVGGYECLHFQEIHAVLKEDDQVTIRALQTSDLRIRRIGGRHQISVDGRHLFDGVAFGRPYLRKTVRPAFRIPSRKRRKLDFGHGQYIEDDLAVQALLAETDNAAYTALDTTRDAADSHPSTDNPLQVVTRHHFGEVDEDSAGDEDGSDFEEGDQDPTRIEDGSEGDSDLESFYEEGKDLELSEELKALLDDDPSESENVEGEEDSENDQALNAQPRVANLNSTGQHKKRKRDSEATSEDGSIGLFGSPTFPPTGAHITELGDVDSSSTSTSRASSEATEGLHLAEIQREAFDDFYGFDEEAHSSTTSSSGVTSSESEGERESSDNVSSLSRSLASSETTSESGSDSHLESGSESEGGSSDGLLTEMSIQTAQPAKTEAIHSSSSVSVQSAPGEGSIRTRRNNERQKKRKRLDLLKAAGELAPDAGFKELSAYENTKSKADVSLDSAQQDDLGDAFNVRRKALLEQLLPPDEQSTAVVAPPTIMSHKVAHASVDQTSTTPGQSLVATGEEINGDMPRKRAKLDIESSRRMVFASLGLKNPRTPAAKAELPEKLAKKALDSAAGQDKQAVAQLWNAVGTKAQPVAESAEPEAWKAKLDLSAVECEESGRILSQPPFPFVQRWEQPNDMNQLQGQLNQHEQSTVETKQDVSICTESLETSVSYIDGDSILDGVRLNGVIQNQLMREAQELSKRQIVNSCGESDLPLITDFNVLGPLRAEDAVAGVVIAFKQLDMSKETNWQPQISAYRTARIQEVHADGTLKIFLAERDRTPIPPSFDDQTGERIFDKFEMPIEEGEESQDTALREVLYGDLIEPKLVKSRMSELLVAQSTQGEQSSRVSSKTQEETSEVKDSAKSTDHSIGQLSAQVEVSTPRQKEISNLIKDAGFHSSLDSELLQPMPEPVATFTGDDDKSTDSPERSDKHASNLSVNLDGAPTDADAARLDSPFYAGSDSSPAYQDNEFFDTSSNVERQEVSSGIHDSQKNRDSSFTKEVTYPRISQLAIDEGSAPKNNGKCNSAKIHNDLQNENGHQQDHASDEVRKDDDSIFERGESSTNSMKSTIPPSEDAAPKSPTPSSSSRITNPVYGLDGNDSSNDGNASSDDGKASADEGNPFSDDDLPSLSEITSTARSGKVSPPPLSKLGKGKQKKSMSPELKPSPRQTSSTESHTHTQPSSRFEPSQIPPGSQFVDLTLCSDPISPIHSEGDYRSSQRNPVRIKQSSSQVQMGETLSSGPKIGNRRLVKGRTGRYKP
jgi:hypothetical protein